MSRMANMPNMPNMANMPNMPKKKRKISKLSRKGTFALLLLGLPGILYIFVFRYLPFYGIILPFKNFKPLQGIFGSPWVGFKNFEFLFLTNLILRPTFNTIYMNLLFFTFNTVCGVALALLLYEVSSKAVKVYQTIYFMPYFLSWAIVALIVLGYLDSNGFVSHLLNMPAGFYNKPSYWPVILIVVEVWKILGYASLIYYAAVVAIDQTYFEAAAIDGANKLQRIRHVTLPSIMPMIVMINLLALGGVFYGDAGLFYNVTQNNALLYPTTDVIDTFVLRALVRINDIGMSSAAGLYQSVCGLILVLASNLAARKLSPDNALF